MARIRAAESESCMSGPSSSRKARASASEGRWNRHPSQRRRMIWVSVGSGYLWPRTGPSSQCGPPGHPRQHGQIPAGRWIAPEGCRRLHSTQRQVQSLHGAIQEAAARKELLFGVYLDFTRPEENCPRPAPEADPGEERAGLALATPVDPAGAWTGSRGSEQRRRPAPAAGPGPRGCRLSAAGRPATAGRGGRGCREGRHAYGVGNVQSDNLRRE